MDTLNVGPSSVLLSIGAILIVVVLVSRPSGK